jgi:hypothetical protein
VTWNTAALQNRLDSDAVDVHEVDLSAVVEVGVMLTWQIDFDVVARTDTHDTVPMVDDGTGGDATAGDGVYTAIIPASAYQAGRLIRWRVDAVDTEGRTSRDPLFLRPDDSPEYARVREFNLNSNGSDSSYLRQPLAFETMQKAGRPASLSFLMLSVCNGSVYTTHPFLGADSHPKAGGSQWSVYQHPQHDESAGGRRRRDSGSAAGRCIHPLRGLRRRPGLGQPG